MRRVVLAAVLAPAMAVAVGVTAMFTPADATVDFAFRCRDGTISTASTSQGACSHHGGIAGEISDPGPGGGGGSADTPTGQPADQGTVTPGAFCTPEGDTGHTVTGVPMVCSRTATDSRLRWRQAAGGGSGTPAVLDCGSVAVGRTLVCDLSGLPAGAAVTKFVNGTGGEQGTTSSSGTAHFVIQVLSQTSGVLGDPVNVRLQCGTNTLTATAGATTSSGTFTLSCPAAAAPRATPSSVAFTGANIALGGMGGSALVAAGSFLVYFSRRRRAA